MEKYNILLLIIFLLPFLVLSSDALQSSSTSEKIVSDQVANDWRVVWTEVSNDIDKKIYKINITNLQDINRNFNLTVLFNNASFDMNQGDVYFYELKNVTGYELQPIIGNVISPCTFNTSLQCSNTRIIAYDNVSYNRIQYKPSKMQLFKRGATELRKNMGVINIPKISAKNKNDGVVNATKQFLLEINNIPISKTNSGWGSKVRIAITDGTNEFHPWSNSTFLRVKNITIASTSTINVTNYTMLVKIIYDTDMDSNFKDLRFYAYNATDNTETKLNYWVQNYTASNSADVWIGRIPEIQENKNLTIRMYYKNSTVVYNESRPNSTFIHFETSGSSWDTATYWTNETSGGINDNVPSSNPTLLRMGYSGGSYIMKLTVPTLDRSTSEDGFAIKVKANRSEMPSVDCTAGDYSNFVLIMANSTSDANTAGGKAIHALNAAFRSRCNGAGSGSTYFEQLSCQSASGQDCFAPTNSPSYGVGYGVNISISHELLWSRIYGNSTIRYGGETSSAYMNRTNSTAGGSTYSPWQSMVFGIGVGQTGGTTNHQLTSFFDWFFVRKHIQPEPYYAVSAEQNFPSTSAVYYYNNQSNATLLRYGSQLIYNINWTINNTNIKIVNTIFETNITGTVHNYTNTTQYHSALFSITNTTSAKGAFYWKSYALSSNTGQDNKTNKMLFFVDNTPPALNITNVPTNSVTPTVDISVTDNLGLSHCYYNLSLQITPNTILGSNPTVFDCATNPTLSGLSDGNSYYLRVYANDTSNNVNNTQTYNWTITLASAAPSGGGGGGGLISTLPFAIGVKCTSDKECSSGKCDLRGTDSGICIADFCGNTYCDRDRGETFTSCPRDCATITELTSKTGGFASTVLFMGVIGFAILLLRTPKKRKKKKNVRV